MVYHDGEFDEAPFVPQELRGRSGRGDTCTSAYLSRRLTAPPAEAVIWAAAVTSLKLEDGRPVPSRDGRGRRAVRADGAQQNERQRNSSGPTIGLAQVFYPLEPSSVW